MVIDILNSKKNEEFDTLIIQDRTMTIMFASKMITKNNMSLMVHEKAIQLSYW